MRKSCEYGEVAVSKSDFSTQKDLGIVPNIHDGQLLLLQLEHIHASVFDLAEQLEL